MKRIFTTLLLIVSFIFRSQSQVIDNACEGIPCNSLPICGVNTIANVNSYTASLAPFNVNPGGIGNCNNAVGGVVNYTATPNWIYYRLKCYAGGVLNFSINPNDPAADMDWAIWDISVSGCGSLTAGNLLECNSFTGAGATGLQPAPAAGFETGITLTAGNSYIIGISRKSGGLAINGFNINFAGTTANLTDNTQPALGAIVAFDHCNPVTQLKVKMTKPIRCSGIQTADFNITGAPVFTAAPGIPCPGCTSPATGINYGNVTDTVVLNFAAPLPAGTYTLSLTGGVAPQPFFDICANLANVIPTLTFTITDPVNLAITTSLNCGTQQYRDTATASFGQVPYQYKIAGPGQANTYGLFTFGSNVFAGLTGGNTYTITVRDANGCLDSVIVSHPPYIAMNVLTFKKNPPCNNQFNLDTLRVTQVNGGSGPFTFTLGSTPPAGAAGAVLYAPGSWTNLAAGNYTITTTDAYGCTNTVTANIVNPAALVLPTPVSTNPACFGDSTGTITCAATGGTAPVNNYVISPSYPNTVISGPNNNIFSNLPGPGTYTIVVTDANGCTTSNTRTLNTPSQIVIYTGNIPASKINPTCTNPCGGSIIANAIGGTGAKKFYKYPLVVPPNTYADSVLVAGGSFQNLCAGTYTIMAKDVLGCTSTATFVLALPSLPDLTITNIIPPLCNGGIGSIVTGVTGGTGPYTNASYSFSPPTAGMTVTASGAGGVVGTYNGVPAGTYTLRVTDVNNCKDSVVGVIMTQPAALVWNNTTPTNLACNGNNSGSVAVNVSGGTGVITYTITPLGPQANVVGNFVNLSAQCYTITATDANLCTITSTVCLTQPPVLTLAVSNITNVTCNGLCNGSSQSTAAGGTLPYTYSISAPGVTNAATGANSALCAGTYTVTVTDANLCTASTTFTVTQPNLLTVSVSNITNVTCNGLCNGSSQSTASGGTLPYTYAISAPGVTNAATGANSALCAGTYTVTVTDANLCTATTTFTVTQPNLLTVSVSNITNVTCNGLCTGTSQSTAAGGTLPYTYAISAPGVTNAATGANSSLCVGTYTVTVTDANLCTATTTFSITAPAVLTVGVSNISNVLCNGLCTGTSQSTAAGGTLPYTYAISAPGVTNAATGANSALCAGTYTVTVTDANLCTATTTFTVTEPTLLTVSVSNITNVLCNGLCTGASQSTAAGGTLPYTYAISAPGVTNAATGANSALCAGTYTVTVTDANLCTATTTFTVTQPTLLTVSVSNITNVSCNGLCDGTSQSTAAGGTLPYTYAISAPGVTNAATGANSALCAGTYTVTVTDANLCTATTTFTVTQPTLLTLSVSNITNVSCNGLCDGTSLSTAAGGTLPYTYVISAPGVTNAATGANSALCAGTYTVTVTDANLCTATTTFTVTQPTLLTVSVSNITNVSCNGLCDGTSQSTAAGGTLPYTYAISAPGVTNAATGANSALCAGTYTVTVTDANLCTATTTFTVTQPTLLTVSVSNITNVSCNGLCDGTSQSTAAGGTLPYTYAISAPGVTNAATGANSALCAGTYTVTVTDANLCTATTTFTVTQPTLLTVSVSNITNVSCNGLCDGTSQSTAAGGTLPYTYAISAPGVTNAATGANSALCAGTYTVTVTDANLCTATTTFTVTQPTLLTVSVSNITNVSCNGLCDGTSQSTAAGGTLPYTYAISAPGVTNAATGANSALCAGTYTVTVTDANLCTATTTFTVTQPTLLTVSVSNISNVLCNGFCTGTSQSTAAGGTLPYTYAISAPGVTNAATGANSALCAGTYTVTVTDANLCSATTVFTITEPTAVSMSILSSANPSCTPGCDGLAIVDGTGGTGLIVFTISPALGIVQNPVGIFTGLCAGTNYVITGTDANGCTGTTNISLSTPNAPVVLVSNISNVTCNGLCDGTAQASATGGTTPYIFSINAPGVIDINTGAVTGLCAGSYTVTVTDANSCVGTISFTVTEPNLLTLSSTAGINPSCTPGCDGTATTTTTGGTPGFTYAISGGAAIDVLGNASNLCGGITYTITVTDANNCTAQTTILLNAPNSPTINITTSTNPTCTPGCDGTATTTTTGGTPGFTYAISGGAAIDVLGNASNLCGGITYTITVTDANNCTAQTTISLSTPNAPVVLVSNISNVTCNGLCDGTAQASATGGATPYIFSINAPGVIDVNTGAITGLCAGSYTVTVTDANSCVGTISFTVTEPNLLTLSSTAGVNPTCVPGCDGTATTTTTGGTPGFTYAISGGAAIDVLGNASNLCGGITYTITVTDANNCTAQTTILLNAPNSPTITIASSTNPSCVPGCDGTVTVTTSGGLAPLVITISPAAGIVQNPAGTFSGLCAGTNYIITVTDANGCTATTNISLSTPNAPVVLVSNISNVTCNGLCDGTAQASATGGTTPYIFSINAPGVIDINTGAITGLCAGSYTVTVTDANSCVGTISFTVTEPNLLTLSSTAGINPSCTPGCDGTATTITAGGTPGFTYAISGGAAIDVLGNASNLCGGITYTITVTDANNCTAQTTILLNAPNSPTINITTSTNPTCLPGCDGTATTTTTGGTPGFTYAISGGAAIDVLGNASNLCGGITYTITVTDANNCTAQTTILLNAPNAPTINITTSTNPTCLPGCDGTATTTTTGGTPGFTYAISGGAAIDVLGNASNLCGGITYTITVTDANNCTAQTTILLNAPNSPTINITTSTNPTCVPGCDGTATTTTTGGTPGFTYAISGGAAIDVLGNASNLCGGITYTITVTDANNCTAQTTILLNAPNSPTINITTSTNPTCVPGCDGTATTTTTGGTPGFTYAISGGAAIDVLGNASNLCGGITYTITVTDANNCTAQTTILLNAPNSPTITIASSTNPSCVPGCDGTVTVTTSGGLAPLVITISPAAGIVQNPAGTFSGLCAGTNYIITVTDANGCTATTNISLSTPNAPVVLVSNISNVTCNGLCDGTAQASATGGTTPYIFSINAPGVIDINTGAITGLCAGSYTVTVTDANSCVGTISFTVTEPNLLTLSSTAGINPSCTPGCDGTATTTTTGGTPVYTYTISGGAAIDVLGNASNLCGGITYTITVTDANNCTAQTTILLNAPNSPTINITTSTNPTCLPGCDGTATTTTTGGTPGFTYAISGGAAIDVLGNASNLCGGITYTITVTDANNCTAQTTILLNAPNSPTINITTSTNPTCVPGCDGTATTTTTGGTPGFTYAISGGAAIDVLGNASNLCGGITYTITVTDANNCTAQTTILLNAPNSPTINITTSTNPTCLPGCDGTATTTTTGGTPGFTYAISGGAAIDVLGNASNLCGGITYTITVTDANNCTAQTTILLNAPNSPTINITTSTNPTCVPGCDGTAATTTTGGTPGFTYAISGGAAIDVLGNASNLCGGITYTITVTDANNCTAQTTILLNAPNSPTITIASSTNPSCVPGCDGTVTVTTSGGLAPLVITISPAAGIVQNPAGTFSGLCAGTNYIITVTDANGCTATTNISLSTPNAPVVLVSNISNVTCNGLCDGTAQASATGGTTPYIFSINAPGVIDINTGAITGLCAGSYTVTVTDANSCVGTISFTVTEPNLLTLSSTAGINPSCTPGCDGTATTTTTGGTPVYTYTISGGAAIDVLGNASNLCGGITYTITVTDANNCTAQTTILLNAPNSPTINITTSTNPTCLPGCDGTATTTTTGGTPGFTYAISGGAAIDVLGNASNLCGGITYTITVTDANNCTAQTTILLNAPNSPTINITTSTNPTCVPGCDGTATTTTTGGTPGFTYAISGGAAIDVLGNASNLCGGITYTITVTDANNCTAQTTILLNAPNSPTINITTSTNPSCVPGCDGTATTTTTGGTPGFTYAISGGAAIDVLGNASNLCGGITYTITVTDANNCTAQTTILLNAPNSPVLQVSAQTNVSCFGLCDGAVTVSANGGTPPYNFSIVPLAVQGPAGTFTGLCAGAYAITVTDLNGCTNVLNINITQPPLLTVNVTAFTNVSVFGGSDGTITVAAAGGSPVYSYVISPAVGAQGPAGAFTGLTATGGQQCYTITVTDANNCTASTTQCITQPAIGILTAVSTDENCYGSCDGTVTATIAGGVAPFNFVLTPGGVANGSGFYSNLCAGTYTVVVTDANNNTTSTTAVVSGPPQIIWNNATVTNVTCFGAGNGMINVNASGGIGQITYTISPLGPQPNNNGVYVSLPPQCYTITATDGSGCVVTTSLCVTEPPLLSLSGAVVQNNTCNGGASGTIAINAIGGNPIPVYTYVLTPGGQTNTNGQFTGLGAGTYTVTVTDGSGCTASTGGIVIGQPAAIVFSTVNLHEVYCYGQATGSIAVVAGGGTGNILFSISPNATQFPLGFFKDLNAGTYIITATDANGCTSTTAATIVENPELRITSLTIVEPICAYDSTGVISVTATGGVAPILYSLNNGIPQLTGTFTGLVMDNYKVTLIDNLGCSTDTTITVTGPTLVGASLQTEDTKCIDSKDGRVTIVGTGGRGGYKYYVTPGLHINKTGRFYDLAAGTYTIRVVDTVGCEYMTTFTINPPANPLGNTMTKQDLNCNGKGNEGSATANVYGGQPPYVYEWSTTPVQNTALASTLYFGWYNVLIADANGCEYRDSVYIEEGPCCDVSFIPNAFSPNGDNNNDEFRVFSTAGIILIQLEVYDRWGQKLWSTADWRRGWDGTVDGKEAGVGTYFYVFRYTCTRDGNSYIKKGDVTLIR